MSILRLRLIKGIGIETIVDGCHPYIGTLIGSLFPEECAQLLAEIEAVRHNTRRIANLKKNDLSLACQASRPDVVTIENSLADPGCTVPGWEESVEIPTTIVLEALQERQAFSTERQRLYAWLCSMPEDSPLRDLLSRHISPLRGRRILTQLTRVRRGDQPDALELDDYQRPIWRYSAAHLDVVQVLRLSDHCGQTKWDMVAIPTTHFEDAVKNVAAFLERWGVKEK